MSKSRELHNQAMALVDQITALKMEERRLPSIGVLFLSNGHSYLDVVKQRQANIDRQKALYDQAHELELQAAKASKDALTRCFLYHSAASLAFNAALFDKAKELAEHTLTFTKDTYLIEQLHKIIARVDELEEGYTMTTTHKGNLEG